jgi:hypothetical protein
VLPRQTFNRRSEFVVARGTVWYRSNAEVTGIEEPWAKLEAPACLDGRVRAISADDDEMVVVDEDRWIYLPARGPDVARRRGQRPPGRRLQGLPHLDPRA